MWKAAAESKKTHFRVRVIHRDGSSPITGSKMQTGNNLLCDRNGQLGLSILVPLVKI